jgi:hypothetical protein
MASSVAPDSEHSSRAGRVKGAKNFSEEELELLLDLAERFLPNSRRKWAALQEAYMQVARERGWVFRTSESLQQKFERISIPFAPTGSATPSQVSACAVVDTAFTKTLAE